MSAGPEQTVCPLCGRAMMFPSRHHVVPRSRGGRETILICRDCHDAVHVHFTLKELEREFSTLDALLTRESFVRTLGFIRKQPSTALTRTRRTTQDKRRGRFRR